MLFHACAVIWQLSVCVSLFVLVARLPESVSAPAVKTKTMMHDNLQVQSRRQARQVKSA